jgi:putative spermidine/putrescine transport system substrate-binding protein
MLALAAAATATAQAAPAPPKTAIAHGAAKPASRPAASPAAAAKPAAAKPAPPQPAAAPPPSPGPAPLAVALPPAAPKDALIRLVKPYAEATGTDLAITAWDGASLDTLAKTPPDLVLVSGPLLLAGCKSQALVKLDWGVLNRDHYLPQAISDCGAGAFLSATALAWDRDKLPETPDWGDFWDVARHPGGRGLQRVARGNLEIALLADGVSAGDVYRTLRTADGLDRAFRKLDQLKPYIIWWDQPAQPAQMLAAGRVLLTVAPTAALLLNSDITRRHDGLQWRGALTELQSWAVPQNAPHQEAAAAALLIAGDIARQAAFAKTTDQGPTARAAIDLLPATVKAGSPSAPANLQNSLAIDETFWADNGDKLQARFAAWAAK